MLGKLGIVLHQNSNYKKSLICLVQKNEGWQQTQNEKCGLKDVK